MLYEIRPAQIERFILTINLKNNVEWKEFFKPTTWKIILTFVIPLYVTYTVHYAMAIPPAEGIWYQLTFYPIPIPIVYFMIFTYSGAQPLFSFGEQILHFALNYLIPLTINYGIVSSIIHLYKKFKK